MVGSESVILSFKIHLTILNDDVLVSTPYILDCVDFVPTQNILIGTKLTFVFKLLKSALRGYDGRAGCP